MVFIKQTIPTLSQKIANIQSIGLNRTDASGLFSYNFIDDATTLKLKAATDSLTESQARLVLSYTSLSKAEIEHVMNQRMQDSSTQDLTLAQIEQVAAINGVTLANDGETMSALVMAEANGTLTASTIASALALEGFSDEQIKAILTGLNLEYQNYKTAGSFGILAKSIGSVFVHNPYVWLITAAAGVTIAIKNMKDAIEEGRQKVSELGSEFNKTKDDLQKYKDKINELSAIIKDQSNSIDVVINARKQLSEIQMELINQYGHEKTVIDSVTDAINGQANALDRIADIKWQETINKINDVGFWGEVGNFFDGYDSGYDRFQKEMFSRSSHFYIDANAPIEQRLRANELFKEHGWNNSGTFMSYSGSTEHIRESILEIQNTLSKEFGQNLDYNMSKSLTSMFDSVDKIFQQYKDYANEYVLREMILPDKTLSDQFRFLQDEYNKFLNATTQDVADESLHVLANHLKEIFNDENIPDSVRQFFKNLYPTIIQEENHLYELESYKNASKVQAASLSGGYNGRYEQKVGWVRDEFNKEWSDAYDEFIKAHNINSEEEFEILNGYIAKYHDLDKAFLQYAKDVETESPILDYANKKDKSKYEGSDYVNDAQSDIKALGDALKQLQEGTMDDSSLIDFFQDFPEFQNVTGDLEEAIKRKLVGSIEELEEATGKQLPTELKTSLFAIQNSALQANRTLNETFNTVKNSSGVLKEFKELRKNGGQMTESMLSSIAGLSDELDTMVAGFYGGVVTVEELYDAVEKQREIDFERYKQSYIMKQALDENYYKNAITGHKEVVKLFNEQYKMDLKNFTSYQMAKTEVQKKILGKQMSMISLYFDLESMQYTEMYTKLENDAKMSVGHAYSEYTNVRSLIEQYKKAIDDLNQIGWTDFLDEIDKMGFGNFDKILGSTKDYDELFDFFERRIELIDQALNKLDASLEEVNGSMAKNILIAGKIGIVQEEIKDYTNALSMYEQKASAELAKLPADLQNKIKNGAVSITRLMGENGEEVNKVLGEYKNWADKVNDCNLKLIELKETLRDLALDRFNNVIQDYTDQFDILSSSNDLISKQMDVFEEAGQLIGKAFYESQIETSQRQKALLEKEKAALVQEMSSSISSGLIQKGTDEWLEMVKAIQDVDSNILDVDQTVEQLQNSLLELNDKVFERLQNTFSDIKGQLSNIVGMISDVDVSDEEGVWSDEGLTQLGAFTQQYELARYNVEKYQEEIDKLNSAYNDGLYSTTEYLDKLSDLAQAQWEEANAAEDAKKSILDLNKARVDMIKQGIQKQIDAYKELIDKQKEALDQEKSIRDYEKTIAEKSKNINKLQNQINLLRNDDSAAANAKRIKLEQELADAMEDLEETQYDHSIDAQKEALDQQMKDFEDARQKEIDELEEYLKDVDRVQKDSFELVKQNTEVVARTIENIAKTHGVIISETITNSWASGEGAIASYGTALSSASSGFIQQIQTIELYLVALQDEADFTADRLVGMLSAKADNLLNEFNTARDSENDLITATELLNAALIKTLEGGYDVSGIIGSMQKVIDKANETAAAVGSSGLENTTPYTSSTTTSNSGSKNSFLHTNADEVVKDIGAGINSVISGVTNDTSELIAKAKTEEKNRKLGYLDNSFKYGSYYNTATGALSRKYIELADSAQYNKGANDLKKAIDAEIERYRKEKEKILSEYAGYATGVHNLSSSQFAWTQENGHELILSPTRNAVLTQLNKGDTVLTKEQTDNLFKLSKVNPEEVFGKFRFNGTIPRVNAPVLTIGNVLTVNGNIDDNNVEKMKAVAATAINNAFKKFSNEIVKR